MEDGSAGGGKAREAFIGVAMSSSGLEGPVSLAGAGPLQPQAGASSDSIPQRKQPTTASTMASSGFQVVQDFVQPHYDQGPQVPPKWTRGKSAYFD